MRISHGYRKTDVPRLNELNEMCFKGQERPPVMDFTHMLAISEVWLAHVDGEAPTGKIDYEQDKIVGFIIVNLEHGAYLWSVAVDPGYQQRGVAGNLIREAELYCRYRGEKTMRLHCHVNNPSQKLYFDRGFRTFDLAHGYYGEGTLALMMKKAL